ncbi:MAG: chitobiase/beta-hexosaminidase C-terminal domain-containing protein [Deltaproteobacteria bacterium]|nr:chitobiase/beta-hexosaminidase C-terminal domain-containing protein [Deltaproteobacteria bacterium]
MLFLIATSACAAPPGVDEKTSELSNATTVVSLTFDDTLADQYQVADIAEARGMRAVFYINSTRIGAPNHMTSAQVLDLQTRGHEIGGHTLTHANLAQITEDQARDQICNDRVALLDAGYAVTSFAYPFGSESSLVQQITRSCGYNSARDVGGLRSATCPSCPLANPIPPANVYQVRTYNSIHRTTTLETMQQQVLDAEQNGGGYVPIVFHHVCDGCSEDAITPALLGTFLDWLATRGPATQVGTDHEVIGGGVQPGVRYPEDTSTNLLRNPSLEADTDGNQVPDCWQRGSVGTNTATYTLTSDAADGVRAQQIQITSLSSGGRRLVTAQDTGSCAPAVTPGHTYTMSAFYQATVQPRFSVYIRNASGAWVWFAESPLQPTSAVYRKATYTTPPIPAGATALSLGLGIFATGTITMDNYTLADTAPPPPATDTIVPLLALACNGTTCSTQPYSSPVNVSLTASDAGSGIREVSYTTDGSDPMTGTLYTGPFTVSSTATVRAVAIDNEDNFMAQSARLTITPVRDTTPPTLAIECNGTTCASTAYASTVSVSLAASDAGSGVREIRYTTDGSDPINGTIYTAPFTLAASATVRATAVDNANNRSTATATIAITAPPPATNLLQNPSLETDVDGNQIPDCWHRGGYGTNTSTYTLVADAFDGTRAQRVDITSWTSGGRRLNTLQDTGACAPAVTPGARYTLTAMYKATIQPRVSIYYRNASGTWAWFAESAPLPVSATYVQATYTTPALPAGATAISAGLSIFGVGSLTTDAYTLVEATPAS